MAVVLGTMPEAIKMAPVIRAMENSRLFSPVLISTGQHRELLEQMLRRLRLTATHDLAVMRERQQPSALTACLTNGLGEVIREERPDLVMVPGETSSTLCGTLAAFREQIPVAHVEAGLRRGVRGDSFPQELNQRLVTPMTKWHFAPTARAAAALTAESVPAPRVMVTGSTAIDNLLWARHVGEGRSAFCSDRRGVLMTLHRRQNHGATMRAIAAALLRVAERQDVEVLVPVHKSPTVRGALLPALKGHPRITLTEPLDYFDFISTLASCELVLTDSARVPEEAPSFNKPILVLRDTTERLEAVQAGAAQLVGTDPRSVHTAVTSLLNDPDLYGRMVDAPSPFGDGHASDRILGRLAGDFGWTPAPASALDVTAA
ncbi:non-hydrolyzing UDP-N-acetylglucosamine 2-epimerase [Streptomyces sp. CA-288835]|uniref:non-hydrolyzing UDP-N-acetylglucosamine 2-epimerase n=1 Tax=Streptomyces sp. CA-288835 TaxID=3240069 RepID=UPI003D9264E8